MIALIVAVLSIPSADAQRVPAIDAGVDRLAELQRDDPLTPDWNGTWFWFVGNMADVTNLTGVTALGALEAYRHRKDPVAEQMIDKAAKFLREHLGAGATGTPHSVRMTAPDIVFLHDHGELDNAADLVQRACDEWTHVKSFWPTADDLDALFRSINRASVWDLAFYMEAASRCDDDVWADDAAAIIADVDDAFYYDANGIWYVLNVAAAIRSLAGEGYGSLYQAEVHELLGILVGLAVSGDGVNGAIQETAYAVMAFKTVGFSMNRHANNLARWLSDMQEENGGWLESDDNEYAEINGEAVRAMAMTVGRSNVPGVKSNVPPKLVATLNGKRQGQPPF
ncbi:MAG: hypothetical protein ACREIR_17385 [Geminicoccaceae bacterium]